MSRSPGRDDPNPCIMPRERNRWIRRWTRDTLNGPADLCTFCTQVIGDRGTRNVWRVFVRKTKITGRRWKLVLFGPRKWRKSIGIPTTRGVAILGEKNWWKLWNEIFVARGFVFQEINRQSDVNTAAGCANFQRGFVEKRTPSRTAVFYMFLSNISTTC